MPNATAPYNFVALPGEYQGKWGVLHSPLDKYIPHPETMPEEEIRDGYTQYIRDNQKKGDCLSGEIVVDMKTLTPCFIGAKEKDDSFFAPTGRPIIPGSSLRGMVKNLFKVLTCGALRAGEDYNDVNLYFRGVGRAAGRSSFISHYNKLMGVSIAPGTSSDVAHSESKARGGYIVKAGAKYYIYAAQSEAYRITDTSRTKTVAWSSEEKGWICYTGAMNNKKHNFVIPEGDWGSEPYEVPQDVLESYQNDKRRAGVNVIPDCPDNHAEEAPNHAVVLDHVKKYVQEHELRGSFIKQQPIDSIKWAYPCFFIVNEKNKKEVKSFGFGNMYRVPYEHSVGDHIPEELKSDDVVDFADAVFGRIDRMDEKQGKGRSFWAGRVFFGDANLQSGEETEAPCTVVLGPPNPTSYQLYLRQDGLQPSTTLHWDGQGKGGKLASIRGYKFYWHKKGVDRSAPEFQAAGGENDNVKTTFRPLKSGARFKGHIRFRDLSRIELGALMKVFDLAVEHPNVRYKIGKGKSLGMGSVEIKTTLRLDVPEKKYASLFGDKGWADAREEISSDSAKYREILAAFDKYRKDHYNEKAYDKVEEELATMLDWSLAKSPGWDQKIKTMTIDQEVKVNGKPDKAFQSRIILQTVSEVAGKGTTS